MAAHDHEEEALEEILESGVGAHEDRLEKTLEHVSAQRRSVDARHQGSEVAKLRSQLDGRICGGWPWDSSYRLRRAEQAAQELTAHTPT